MMLTALLFDLDGTLANTDPIHFQTWRDILTEYELAIDEPFYKANFSGRLNIDIVQDLLPHLSLEEGHQLGSRKEAAFRNRAEVDLKPLTGLAELLQWADECQLRTAVVTNAPPENARFMLRVLGLESRFDRVIIGEELERGKPDPLPYKVALEQLGVLPEAAVAFEDSASGIRSAIGAGLLTIGVASTLTSQELLDLGATIAISDFTDPQLDGLLRSPLIHEQG